MTRQLPQKQRREQIIDAAILEFAEKGYEKASMGSIAARAGLSKGGLYHHFASKDAVLAAANERVSVAATHCFRKINGLDSPRLKLKTYISEYLDYWSQSRKELAFIFISIAKSIFEPELFKAYEQYISQTVDSLAAVYRSGIEQGELIEHDCRAQALALCAALDGVSLYLNTGSALELAEIKVSYGKTFVDSLGKRS